jgi:hypothetical protein
LESTYVSESAGTGTNTASTSTSSTTASSSAMTSTTSTNASENNPLGPNYTESSAAATSPSQYVLGGDSALSNDFTLVTVSASGVTGLETFVPVTLSLSNLSDTAFSTYVTYTSGNTLPALIGPSGVGWEAFGIPLMFQSFIQQCSYHQRKRIAQV